MTLITQARALGLPVDRRSIMAFGRKVKATLEKKAPTPAERTRLKDFNASEGWAKKMVTRFSLKSKKLHGQAGSVDDAAIADALRDVREKLAEYEPGCIINCDETALQYRMLPSFTYTAPGEAKKTVRGVKGMAAKERVTLYVATDASGRKVPLSMIDHSKNPRCFRLRVSPMRYFSQANAWSDSKVFPEWFHKVLLPHVCSVTSKPVVLLMDNHSSHANLVDPRGQVTILELPPNCTAKHQPADAGIIAALKRRYRSALLAVRVDTMDSAAQLREEAKKRKVVAGCRGLAEGSAPHILDAAEMCQAAWEWVSKETILRCWKKADILSPAVHAEIDQEVGRTNATGNADKVDEVAALVSRLSIGVKRSGDVHEDLLEAMSGLGLRPGEKPTSSSMAAMEAWISVEEDEEVAEAIVSDMTDDLCDESMLQLGVESDDSEVDAPDVGGAGQPSGAPVLRPPPPYSGVADHFRELEDVAENCGMHDASYHLRKAKLAWMSNFGAREAKQTCMRDSFDGNGAGSGSG